MLYVIFNSFPWWVAQIERKEKIKNHWERERDMTKNYNLKQIKTKRDRWTRFKNREGNELSRVGKKRF